MRTYCIVVPACFISAGGPRPDTTAAAPHCCSQGWLHAQCLGLPIAVLPRHPASVVPNPCLTTAGEPKAVVWSHVTPIRCGVDAWAHHDLRPGAVAAWPTNLGKDTPTWESTMLAMPRCCPNCASCQPGLESRSGMQCAVWGGDCRPACVFGLLVAHSGALSAMTPL